MDTNTPDPKKLATFPELPLAEPPTPPTTATSNPTAQPVKPDGPPKRGMSHRKLRWAKTVPELLGYAGFWVAQTGVSLLKLKKRIPHENWLRLAEGFDPETLGMLLNVGANKALANPQHLGSLPFSLKALHALAQLDREIIEKGISQGAIHPRMTEAKAKEFINNPNPKTVPPQRALRASFHAEKEASQLTQHLMNQLEEWPSDQRGRAVELLLGLADQLQAGLPPSSLRQAAEFSVRTCHYQELGLPAPVKKPTITPM